MARLILFHLLDDRAAALIAFRQLAEMAVQVFLDLTFRFRDEAQTLLPLHI